MFKFEELNVYQDAIKFAEWIYLTISNWPKNEQYGLSDQIRRASVSIGLNIAEGTSRTKKDFSHFLDLARGSCYECVAVGSIAKNIGYLNDGDYKALYDKCEYISKRISALKNSLNV